MVLIKKAFTEDLVIPEFQKFLDEIQDIYDNCKDNDGGAVSTCRLFISPLTLPSPIHLTPHSPQSNKGFISYFMFCFQPASYIPQLARVNPDYWGVAVCTVDGQRCVFSSITPRVHLFVVLFVLSDISSATPTFRSVCNRRRSLSRTHWRCTRTDPTSCIVTSVKSRAEKRSTSSNSTTTASHLISLFSGLY